ncbi:MAG: SpoIIE family protein phosphatase [Planctomycetota bacterium]
MGSHPGGLSIRRKLLLLLLFTALVPLAVVGWHGRRTTRRLGRDLSGRTRETLTDLAATRLERLAASYGEIFSGQDDTLDLVIRAQAREFAHQLAKPPLSIRPATPLFSRDFDTATNPPEDAVTVPERYHRVEEDGTTTVIPVSLERASIHLPIGCFREKNEDLISRLAGSADVFRHARPGFSNLLHWQYAAFESGVHVTWPGHGRFPASFDARQRSWYRRAMNVGGPVWSTPMVDASTREIIVTLSAPIPGPTGKFVGVTGIDVRLEDVLDRVRVPESWAEGARAHIVAIRPREDGEGSEFFVIVERDYLDRASTWDRPIDVASIHRPGKRFARMLDEISRGGSGVVEMPWNGAPCLWGFGAINDHGMSFLIIVPTEVVVAEAAAAEREVLAETRRQLLATGAIFLVVMVLVIFATIRAARTVTRPVRALMATADRIASGDLDARTDIRSRDEFERLGETFNSMVPKLRDRLEIRESLDIARRVQQHLLPETPPVIDGLDVAGTSQFCDETGGDYYDWIDLRDQAPDRIGVAVGDVSGHGIGSALFMAGARATLRTRATREERPSRLISEVNRRLAEDSVEGRYMTLLWVVLDTPARSLRWVNAGHLPGLLYDPATDAFEELSGDGLPLGIDAEAAYETSGLPDLGPGRVLFLGTDGVQETRDELGRMFGGEALRELIRKHHARPAATVVERITAALAEHRGTAPRRDDVTLVVVKLA